MIPRDKTGTRIAFLHSEITGYWEHSLNLLSQNGYKILVFHLENELKVSPYTIVGNPKIEYHSRQDASAKKIYARVQRFRPDVIVISGWMDAGYLLVASVFKARGTQVISMFDDQWHGTARQILGGLLMKIVFRRMFFSGAWVCGTRQAEFARRMGFRDSEIRQPLLSADIEKFNRAEAIRRGSPKWPRRFLFVGRLESHKGLRQLLLAWEGSSVEKRWPLTVIGSGSLEQLLKGKPGITHIPFADSETVAWHAANSGCFILPSTREGWGVVVHEAAASGLPLLLTPEVGAGDSFLIDGFNGFLVEGGSTSQLSAMMQRVTSLSDATLQEFGQRSVELSRGVTPELSLAALLSFLPRSIAGDSLGSP